MIPIARPQMGEEEKERVWEAMSSGSLAQGPRVKQLEDEFAALSDATDETDPQVLAEWGRAQTPQPA